VLRAANARLHRRFGRINVVAVPGESLRYGIPRIDDRTAVRIREDVVGRPNTPKAVRGVTCMVDVGMEFPGEPLEPLPNDGLGCAEWKLKVAIVVALLKIGHAEEAAA
jgi:hypothetical protein